MNVSKKIMVYYPEWLIYDKQYTVWDMPLNKITHVKYAFLDIVSGKACLADKWAAIGKPFLGYGDSWCTSNTQPFLGNLNQLGKIRKLHRNIKVLATIDGITNTFASVLTSESSIETFVKSCVDLVHTYGFDGIDLSLEEDEILDYNALEMLFKMLRKDLGDYEIGLDIPVTENILDTLPHLNKIESYVDNIGLVTCDFPNENGFTETVSSHQTNLYNDKYTRFSIDGLVKSLNVENSNKIIICIPLYARHYLDTDGLHKPFRRKRQHITDYKDMPLAGQTEYFDEKTMSTFAYNCTTRTWSSYDSVESVQAKCDYVIDYNLGGIMLWEISGDSKTKSVVDVIYKAFDKDLFTNQICTNKVCHHQTVSHTIDNWQVDNFYKRKDFTWYDGSLWECLVDHLSSQIWMPHCKMFWQFYAKAPEPSAVSVSDDDEQVCIPVPRDDEYETSMTMTVLITRLRQVIVMDMDTKGKYIE